MQGDTITIDAPITCAIERQWGGGEILKYDDAGRIFNVGVENLRGVSEFNPEIRTRNYGNMDRQDYVAEEYYSDENHYYNFIMFDNVRNGWVRNATALHFVYSMVGTARWSKWITIQDCVSKEPISQRAGARRFVFALRGQLALVQRCRSDKGRHSFRRPGNRPRAETCSSIARQRAPIRRASRVNNGRPAICTTTSGRRSPPGPGRTSISAGRR